jgi:hypothetical protein
MMTLKALLDFLNPLQTNRALYKSLTDLVTAKLEAPQLSIRAAKKWGILDLSTSFHYDKLKGLGELFIDGVISLEDFLLYSTSNKFHQRLQNHQSQQTTPYQAARANQSDKNR